ncbi:MAG TPA: hypothetical protein VGM32_06755 [Rhodopila sp.]
MLTVIVGFGILMSVHAHRNVVFGVTTDDAQYFPSEKRETPTATVIATRIPEDIL